MRFSEPHYAEKNFFNFHIPGNITDQCSKRFCDYLPQNFIPQLFGNSVSEIDLTVNRFNIETIFTYGGGTHNELLVKIPAFQEDENLLPFDLESIISNFGRDAFGIYLPFHYYDECWGIYLFKEIIQSRVKILHTFFNQEISYPELLQMYYYAVYRHELFHYQVERFSTKLELITKNKIYRLSRLLFDQVKNTEDWLEEALAESAVIHSKLVPLRTGISAALVKKIYKRDLQDMPAGYRDYECKKFGGRDNAHQLFAGQIIENNINPKAAMTGLLTVKNENSLSDKEVPTYLVTGFNKTQRIRL